MATKGFTLIEILVALLLIGIFLAIAIPSFRSLTRVELKNSANQMVGLVRDTYVRASLSGKVCRIVFDLDKNEYWVEESNDQLLLPDEEVEVNQKEADKLEENRDLKGRKKPIWEKTPEFKKVADELGVPQKLPSGVRFYGIWADHLEDRVRSGQVALHFFSDGYTQSAQISLADDDAGENVLTLVTEPLTGEAVIENGEPQIPKK